ncbi:MAG: hypothetical protein ABR911_07695 [Syntrophales bacterium]
MNYRNIEESLNRTLKMSMDSGEASSIEEAEKIFKGYRLAIVAGPDMANSPTLQSALLTAVNTGRRCFLGGVMVNGDLDVGLQIPWRKCKTLSEAIADIRGRRVESIPPDVPLIVIGDLKHIRRDAGRFAVQATFDGWSGGVSPLADNVRLPEEKEFTPAGVLAGALAVSEAFQHVRGHQIAGHRKVGLSLWRPSSSVSWLDPANAGPSIENLPSRLWLIGLGHLGQAFLWTMGFLPYARSDEVCLVLQDYDYLSKANDSTSLLTFFPFEEEKKTRAMARWCEERGFNTIINEKRFASDFKLSSDDPLVGICGVDNGIARAALEDVGFSRVIEAGLGGGPKEYLAFQIHTLPGPQGARNKWGAYASAETESDLIKKPAYESLAREGFDRCGLTTLAGRSVGASFVGAATSALVIAELLRMVHGWHAYSVVDGNFRSLDQREAIVNKLWCDPFNPGSTGIFHR